MHRENLNLTYARWKNGEVDLVLLDDRTFKPLWGVEIKWSNRYFEKPQELKSLIQFCKENNFLSALVTSIKEEGTKMLEAVSLTFIPASIYAYNIGVKTLEIKKS